MQLLPALSIFLLALTAHQPATAFQLFGNRITFGKKVPSSSTNDAGSCSSSSNSAGAVISTSFPSTSSASSAVTALQSTVLKPSAVSISSFPNHEFKQNLKLGVLFLNLGGPETIEDVEGFLFNLFADPDIIRLPPLLSFIQKPLAYFIAKRRAPKSSSAYESIGGGSPIVKYTQQQSQLVRNALRERGFDSAECYFAMRYWHPYTEETLEQVQKDGVNTLVVVPLYPQFSISTSGSSLKLLQDIFYKQPQLWGPDKVAHTVVPSWYHRPGYSKVMAQLILEKVRQYSAAELAQGVHVLFSAHGVPQSYIAAGDPYQRQIEECVRLITKEVRRQLKSEHMRPAEFDKAVALQLAGFSPSSITSNAAANAGVGAAERSDKPKDMATMAQEIFDGAAATHAIAEASSASIDADAVVQELSFHLSFQSRVGPVKWLQPYTEDMLKELGEEQQVKNLVVVPISFVSEHIETLEEIDMEYRELAEEYGVTNWKRVPALNTEPSFIEDMADLVVEALEAPTLTVAEAASNSYADVLDSSSSGSNGGGSGSGGSSAPMAVEASRQLRGAFAVAGLVSTSALEMLSQHPVLQMLGFK